MSKETDWAPIAAELERMMQRAQHLAERYRQQAGQYGQSRVATLRYQNKARQIEKVFERLATRAHKPGSDRVSSEADGLLHPPRVGSP